MIALVLAAGSLPAQAGTAFRPPAADSAAAQPRPAAWRHAPALPAELAVQPAALHASERASPRAADGPVPFLFGVFGGIAGMFVANWWVQRDCEEGCDEERLYMLFIGGMAGALVGWLAGGGELPDYPPPLLHRQPP